jgi:predicted acylesterase/phospholipase RssA
MLLALSGGGSRAAYFSGSVMLRLQNVFEDIDLLKEIDLISSVSGGSLPAAYYCISIDPEGFTSIPIKGEFNHSQLSSSLKSKVRYSENNRLLGFNGPMQPQDAKELREALSDQKDDERVAKLKRLSQYKVKSNRPWDEWTVKRLMVRNYLYKWIGNWFWPINVIKYWFTAYDRSDIMAQTFSDNLYDKRTLGNDLIFRDLNPERPYLIINATDATEERVDCEKSERHFGEVFTFTYEDFKSQLNSNISRYKISRAVMASAAFPAVFNYMTLRDYCNRRYVHVFDGGNSDNLGLKSLRKVIALNRDKYKKIIVILVDSHIEAKGIDNKEYDPRSLFSYVMDMNMMDSFDSLLESNRKVLLEEFENDKTIEFWHIHFNDVEDQDLKKKLNKIATNFKISKSKEKDHVTLIDRAVNDLISKKNPKLNRIRIILLEER